MSTMISAACWPLQGMTPLQKVVLVSLADNANDHGYCWPSIGFIAQRACASERGVQKAIKWLESTGVLVANRSNGRHTTYTVTPNLYQTPALSSGVSDSRTPEHSSPHHSVHLRTGFTPEHSSPPPALRSGDPRTQFAKPPNGVPSNRKEPSKEPSLNRQGARRAPRVALHREIREMKLPDSIPLPVWAMWCEHREAKADDAPWTRVAAAVSIKRLERLHAEGQSPETTVEEAALRGWTGLFPVKPQGVVPTASSAAATNWSLTVAGTTARGAQLGVTQQEDEVFMHFKARVVKAAGPGEWMEAMLRETARFGGDQYDALYAYFNDIPREKAPALAA